MTEGVTPINSANLMLSSSTTPAPAFLMFCGPPDETLLVTSNGTEFDSPQHRWLNALDNYLTVDYICAHKCRFGVDRIAGVSFENFVGQLVAVSCIG
jgi:hypothetical protein